MPPHEVNAASAGTSTLGDRTVNRLGFGAKRLTGDHDEAIALLRLAIEHGVNHIDTAAFYGSANVLIKEALAPYPDDLVIATKVGPTEGGSARPDQLRGLVEENLRQLGVAQLDLVNLRQHGLESIVDHFGVLAELRESGLIRQLGISNARPGHLAQARAIAPVVCVQNRYGVDFGRVNDDLLRTCGELGIAFVPFFAITATGREEGGVAHSDAVADISQAHSATPAQIRTAWTLSRGPHVLAIPGTSNPVHLVENIAAGSVALTDTELARLD